MWIRIIAVFDSTLWFRGLKLWQPILFSVFRLIFNHWNMGNEIWNRIQFLELQTMVSKFVANFFGGSTIVRVIWLNLLNLKWKRWKHLQFFHENLKLDTPGKYYLLIPFKNFLRDTYPRPLLDGLLSVDIYLNSPSLNPALLLIVCGWVRGCVCVRYENYNRSTNNQNDCLTTVR